MSGHRPFHDPYEDTVKDEDNRRMRRKSGRVDIDSKLVSFLYLLGRDHLPLGVVEDLYRKNLNAEGHFDSESQYTNGWLALWAQDLAERLGDPKVISAPQTAAEGA